MPVVTLAVPQSGETVTRYVVKGIVRDIMVDVGLSPDTDVIYKEDIGGPPTTGGTIDATSKLKLTHDNHVVVRSEELYTENGVITSVLHKPEFPHIFIDKKLGIYIHPAYGIVKNALTIKLYFRDKSSGDKYRRMLRMRGGVRSLVGLHEIRYEYSLPDDILAFLYDAHAMCEPPSGQTKETLASYLNRCFMGGLGRRTTQSGDSYRLILEEVQGNIVGTHVDEIFYNELVFEDGYYSLEFTYNFEYNQILGFVMHFPNVIHNKLIPKIYRKAWAEPIIKDFQSSPIVHRTLSYMPPIWATTVNGIPRSEGGYRLDPTDEWDGPKVRSDVLPILLTPVIVDKNEPTMLLNLNEFTAEQLPPDIKDYLSSYPVESLEVNSSPYLLQAFSVADTTEETTVNIYPDGGIRSTVPMDAQKRHYLKISALTDLSKLSYKHIVKMLEDPVKTAKVISNLAPGDAISGLNIIGNKKITAQSFREVIKNMPTTNIDYLLMEATKPNYISNVRLSTGKRIRSGSL